MILEWKKEGICVEWKRIQIKMQRKRELARLGTTLTLGSVAGPNSYS